MKNTIDQSHYRIMNPSDDLGESEIRRLQQHQKPSAHTRKINIEKTIEQILYKCVRQYYLHTNEMLLVNQLRWKESLCKIGITSDTHTYSLFIEYLSEKEPVEIYLSVSNRFTEKHGKFIFIFENLLRNKLCKANRTIQFYLGCSKL